MRTLTLIIFMLVNVALACDTEEVICKYENMQKEFKERNKTFPIALPLVQGMAIELFTGEQLKSMMSYVKGFPSDRVEGSLIFMEPFESVEGSKEVNKSPNRKEVVRVYVRQVGSVEIRTATIYTLYKKYSAWKIEKMLSSGTGEE